MCVITLAGKDSVIKWFCQAWLVYADDSVVLHSGLIMPRTHTHTAADSGVT